MVPLDCSSQLTVPAFVRSVAPKPSPAATRAGVSGRAVTRYRSAYGSCAIRRNPVPGLPAAGHSPHEAGLASTITYLTPSVASRGAVEGLDSSLSVYAS